MTHYKDDAGIEHVDADQSLGGGLAGTKVSLNSLSAPDRFVDRLGIRRRSATSRTLPRSTLTTSSEVSSGAVFAPS